MNNKYYPASERGHVNFGWLDSHHSFSFGNWHDREKVHFGALRVLNDDTVKGGGGFDAQPHENMEIISIPLKGTLTHKDSTGADGLLHTNDVQIMSAGSGISHSEYNASHFDAVNLLQIWIFPKQTGIKPRHDQRTFYPEGRKDQWQVIVSPLAEDHALWINQDARLALTHLSPNKTITYTPAFPGNGVYVFLLEGHLEIEGYHLEPRDGIGLTDMQTLTLKAGPATANILVIEVPMFA
ncbi:MAG: pirin family protein [Bacteroidetes bacterium]|nr:pirin family protein [Bacteroidota bacterium]